MENKPGKSKNKTKLLLAVGGIVAILIVWQILSWQFSSIIVASPASTFLALGNLFVTGSSLGQSGPKPGQADYRSPDWEFFGDYPGGPGGQKQRSTDFPGAGPLGGS